MSEAIDSVGHCVVRGARGEAICQVLSNLQTPKSWTRIESGEETGTAVTEESTTAPRVGGPMFDTYLTTMNLGDGNERGFGSHSHSSTISRDGDVHNWFWGRC